MADGGADGGRAAREVVVVTGVCTAVGRTTALTLAREGRAVALLGPGAAGLLAAADEIETAGGTALVVRTLLTVPDEVEEAATRVEEELGPIRSWVTVDSDDAGYLGVVNCSAAALRRMRVRDRGTLVQVTDDRSHRAFADSLRSELSCARSAVTVTTLAPVGPADQTAREVAFAVVHPRRNEPDPLPVGIEAARRMSRVVAVGLAGVAAATLVARGRDR